MASKEQTRRNAPSSSSYQARRPKAQNAVPQDQRMDLADIEQKTEMTPQMLKPRDVMQLQRALGNQAVVKLLSGTKPPQAHPTSVAQRANEEDELQAKPLVQRSEDTPVLQRAIIADGEPGAGRMEAPELVSFDGLLEHNKIDSFAFTVADYAALNKRYDGLVSLDKKVHEASAGKKVKLKAALKKAYDDLLKDIKTAVLGEGNPKWDAAVELAVRAYNDLPAAEQKNTDKLYQEISGGVWPAVEGRGAMPDAFWKLVRKNVRTGFRAEASTAAFSKECNTICDDMEKQFTAWDGTLTNRGAWWGSAAPGNTTGAKNVPVTVVSELTRKVSTQWVLSNSITGDISFHRMRGTTAFIYHMRAP